jgi:hypothetical protein
MSLFTTIGYGLSFARFSLPLSPIDKHRYFDAGSFSVKTNSGRLFVVVSSNITIDILPQIH